MLNFKWDEAKALSNLAKHDVSFDRATTVFKDIFAVERLDDRADYGETRFILTGRADGDVLLSVVYTESAEAIRIISARRATRREQDDYFRQHARSEKDYDA
jgi:uncharacterized DUF497 family protein